MGEFVVEEFGSTGFFVALDQDFADSDGTAAVSQALFHGFPRAHDGNSANFAFEFDAGVGSSGGSYDGVLHAWKMV